MTEKVVNFPGAKPAAIQPATDLPVEAVIEVLEKALDRARKGELRCLGFIAFFEVGENSEAQTGWVGDVGNPLTLLGSVRHLEERVVRECFQWKA